MWKWHDINIWRQSIDTEHVLDDLMSEMKVQWMSVKCRTLTHVDCRHLRELSWKTTEWVTPLQWHHIKWEQQAKSHWYQLIFHCWVQEQPSAVDDYNYSWWSTPPGWPQRPLSTTTHCDRQSSTACDHFDNDSNQNTLPRSRQGQLNHELWWTDGLRWSGLYAEHQIHGPIIVDSSKLSLLSSVGLQQTVHWLQCVQFMQLTIVMLCLQLHTRYRCPLVQAMNGHVESLAQSQLPAQFWQLSQSGYVYIPSQ